MHRVPGGAAIRRGFNSPYGASARASNRQIYAGRAPSRSPRPPDPAGPSLLPPARTCPRPSLLCLCPSPASPPSRLTAVGAAVARIGTTLDEGATCAELTREAAGQAGGAAAVLRGGEEAGPEYEAVHGDPAMLPPVRWAAAAAREMAVPVPRVGGEAPCPAYGGARPAVCVPLATDELCYGVLVCARDRAPYTRPDTELLALLAERAASHIRHAREHDRVRGIVGKLQRALLAEPGRPHPNLDVAIRYMPVGHTALVGGDWCETVRLHFGRTLLVVGDVMGHGLEAAVDMTAYRSALCYIASADLPPHRVLRQLDDIAPPPNRSVGRPPV